MDVIVDDAYRVLEQTGARIEDDVIREMLHGAGAVCAEAFPLISGVEAARQGDLPVVQQMIADGVDVNAALTFNITALWQASSKGHREVVEHLLQAKADPNARDGVWLRDGAAQHPEECGRV